MHILLIGSGGREHALAWKLSQSPQVSRISVAPGNPGIAREPKVGCIAIDAGDLQALREFALSNDVHLTIVGPEAPLVAGIVDEFNRAGLRIFGPDRAAAQLEGSKAYAKAFMAKNDIPTAASRTFTNPEQATQWVMQASVPVVIKADGLAAGKGVVVAENHQEAVEAIAGFFNGRFGSAGSTVVIEDFLEGEEASFFAIVSGNDYVTLASSQDHKTRDDGDTGPNTGGMGAYSPAPVVTDAVHDKVIHSILEPTIKGLARQGDRFIGFLYIGLMIDRHGLPRVVEYNVRLGDPETQPLMMRMSSDLLPLLNKAVDGTLQGSQVQWHTGTALGVVIAAGEYPQGSSKGKAITGIDTAESNGCKVFHAGTRYEGDTLVTNGGRVLCSTALAADLAQAKSLAETGAASIHWEGAHYRKDIGHRALRPDTT